MFGEIICLYRVRSADSGRIPEGDEELSDEGHMPQLPASVHVRKSSVACTKVGGRIAGTCGLKKLPA